MTDAGSQRDSFGEQDHVLPQVYFPAIVTLKDPTESTFSYIFTSILKTKRYGAQNTRTGALENIVLGVIFSDSEIFSNLKLTQAIYDVLEEKKQLTFPLAQKDLDEAVSIVVPILLETDASKVSLCLLGEEANKLTKEFIEISSNEESYKKLLKDANEQSVNYSKSFGVDSNPKAKKTKQE